MVMGRDGKASTRHNPTYPFDLAYIRNRSLFLSCTRRVVVVYIRGMDDVTAWGWKDLRPLVAENAYVAIVIGIVAVVVIALAYSMMAGDGGASRAMRVG